MSSPHEKQALEVVNLRVCGDPYIWAEEAYGGMTITLNPTLFNILKAQGHVIANQDGMHTVQDGKKYKVVVVSGEELETV